MRILLNCLCYQICAACNLASYISTADVNYQGLTNYLMTFEEATTKEKDIPIYITNDTDIGMDEEFLVTISYSGEDITRVSLEPQNATVAIFEIDDRGMQIIIFL